MTYVTLVGAEQVAHAGAQMERAAAQFAASVGHLAEALREHERVMDELASRMEAAAQSARREEADDAVAFRTLTGRAAHGPKDGGDG